jgi:hypothetical protein
MTNPYESLGEQILAVARRQNASPRSATAKVRRHRRLRVAVLVLVLALASATIALAASGLLNGSPVKPRSSLNPRAYEGVPAPGGSRLLALEVPDPEGGPAWGMQIVHTTRGEVCLQVGRLHGGRLGELGIDGAFNDDRRFHPLPPDVLPSDSPTTPSSNGACVLTGQTLSGLSNIDRNAAITRNYTALLRGDRREVSFGLLGRHALAITYRTQHGAKTDLVAPGTGAYLIVQRVHRPASSGDYSIAYGSLGKRRPSPLGALSAITYKFGGLVCVDGVGAEVTMPCPRPALAPSSTIDPTRSLHQPLRVTLDTRRRSIDSAELEFTAPYSVRSAHQVYEVIEPAPSDCGGNGGSGLPLERDIRQGQRVQIKLDHLFRFAPKCGLMQAIQVRFINPEGPSATSPHESVIVGETTVTEPPGTHPSPIHGD